MYLQQLNSEKKKGLYTDRQINATNQAVDVVIILTSGGRMQEEENFK